MKDFHRDNPLFSLCGLNCGLCTMYTGRYCPGCGGGDGNQSCAIARCGRAHGDVPYCFECSEYPCVRYEGLDDYDSFIPCRNRKKDVARAREMGTEAYTAELREKMALYRLYMERCNDGRHKSFFMVAACLLELYDLKDAAIKLPPEDTPQPERTAAAVRLLTEAASRRGVELKLRRKPKKKGEVAQ